RADNEVVGKSPCRLVEFKNGDAFSFLRLAAGCSLVNLPSYIAGLSHAPSVLSPPHLPSCRRRRKESIPRLPAGRWSAPRLRPPADTDHFSATSSRPPSGVA